MDSLYLLNSGIWVLSLSVCFSIILLSIQHPYQNPLVIRRGRLFIVPLTVYVLNALNLIPGFSIELVFWIAESLFLIMVLVSYWGSMRFLEKSVWSLLFVSAAIAALVGLLHEMASQWLNAIPTVHYVWTIFIPLAVLYWLNHRKNVERRFFFYGTLAVTLSYGVQIFEKSVYMPEVSILLKMTGYVLWTAHFSLIARTETLTYRHDLFDAERRMERTTLDSAKKDNQK